MKKIAVIWLFLILSISIEGFGQLFSVPDPQLKNYLQSRYPNSFDQDGYLIIANARTETLPLICVDQGIQNADGIQYFTNIKRIRLSNNAIRQLPDLFRLENLEVLEINDNQIDYLPDLSYLTKLKTLVINRNHIQNLSTISSLTGLEELYTHSNPLKKLPDISRLINLRKIHLAYCELDELPDLSHLQQLVELVCYKNNLTVLPDLTNLLSLKYLDAGYNQLKQFPEFSSDPVIETIYLNSNDIRDLPSFEGFSSLIKLRIYDNYLNFEDLLPLTSLDNYNDIYKFTPQKKFDKGFVKDLIETDDFSVTLSEIGHAENQVYQWYKDQHILTSFDTPALHVHNLTRKDAGKYYCKAMHPAFPELILETDTFTVEVSRCLIPDLLTFSVNEKNCQHKGKLTVHAQNQPQPVSFYYLIGEISGDTLESSDGFFDQLDEPSYQLVIQTGKCRRNYSYSINIPQSKCDEIFITPNGDGIDESYFISQSGRAVIRDKFGIAIYELSTPASWEGNGLHGKVSPGLYFIDINNGSEVLQISVIY